VREDELNDTAERARKEEEYNPVIHELRARHDADIASIQRVHSAGVEELKRLHESSTDALKVEYESKISDLKAALDFRVENMTLGLKLKAAESYAALLSADKQLVKCEVALRAAVRDLRSAVKDAGTTEEKLERVSAELVAKETQVTDLQARLQEAQTQLEEHGAVKAREEEKDAAIKEYSTLVGKLREERDAARAEHQQDAESGMKVQEEIVLLRGASRRKEEEARKCQAVNVELRGDLARLEQDAERRAADVKGEFAAKDAIVALLRAEKEGVAAELVAEREAHKDEVQKMEHKLDVERRELLRESEQRNVELAVKAQETSSLLVEVAKLKEELVRVQTHRDDHQVRGRVKPSMKIRENVHYLSLNCSGSTEADRTCRRGAH
jgi:hypothetical protein